MKPQSTAIQRPGAKLPFMAVLGLMSVTIYLLFPPVNRSESGESDGSESEFDLDATSPSFAAPAIDPNEVGFQEGPGTILPMARGQRESAVIPTTSVNREEFGDLDAARQWARQNPDAALAWLSNATDSPMREAVIEMVCAHLAQTNAAQAVVLAERFGPATNSLLENMLHLWADQDLAAAHAHATNQPAGESRDRQLGRVAFVLSRQRPAAAAKLVAEWMMPGQLQDEAALSVLHQWALREPDAARAWAALFPDEALRSRAINEIRNIASLSPPGNGLAPEDARR